METNSAQFKNLVDCLNDQKECYLRIVEVLASEKGYLILADIKSLIENNKFKEALLAKSRALEKIRQLRVEELLKFLKLDLQGKSMSGLIPLLGKEDAKKLIEIQSELTRVLQQVKTANLLNDKLVANAKNVIDSGLKVMKGETPESQVYKKQGKLEKGRAPGKIVSKEV